ncbi:MAG: hypothetical protein IT337_13490 [Thermomicrobiales bacterium]|nr:hypothetical protein [Thermomicrobiales bacterium]
MPPLLLDFARTLAGDDPARPVLAFGFDRPPAEPDETTSPIIPVPPAALQALLRTARDGGAVTATDLADAAGIDPALLAQAVGVVMPGSARLWSSVDAAELAEIALASLSPIVFAARPAGVFLTPAALRDRFARHGASVAMAGSLPIDDDFAPDSPVVVLEREPVVAGAPPVRAFVHARDDADVLPGAIHALAEDGVEVVIVIDRDAPDAARELAERLLGRGAAAVERCHPDPTAADGAPARIAALAAAGDTPWVVALEADERLSGPWPGIGLRETLGRLAAGGHGAVRATTMLAELAPGAPEAIRRWRVAAAAADFGRIVAWQPHAVPARPVAAPRLGVQTAAAPAPWNRLLRRIVAADDPAVALGSWTDWDAEDVADRWLVERLTGHGAFRRACPTPPDLIWRIEERLFDWGGNLLKAGVSRLPLPDPMRPQGGICLIRWDTPDRAGGSLWLSLPGEEERFAGGGASGTISVGGVEPNRRYVARLYRDDERSRLLGEMQFGFDLAVEPDARRGAGPRSG